MQAGPAFRDGDALVFYTAHFVLRFTTDDRLHLAASRFVSEQWIENALRAVLSELRDIFAVDPDAGGIIRSATKRVTMVFALRRIADGFQVTMTTTSTRPDFQRRSPSDYELTVANPQILAHFRRGVAPSLRDLVLDDLLDRAGEMAGNTTYEFEAADLVRYWAERDGAELYVLDADWTRPIYEIEVA